MSALESFLRLIGENTQPIYRPQKQSNYVVKGPKVIIREALAVLWVILGAFLNKTKAHHSLSQMSTSRAKVLKSFKNIPHNNLKTTNWGSDIHRGVISTGPRAGREMLENHRLLARALEISLHYPQLLPGLWCSPLMPTLVSSHSCHQCV